MQGNAIFLLALYVAHTNGANIHYWVWVIAWILFVLRFLSLTFTIIKEKALEGRL